MTIDSLDSWKERFRMMADNFRSENVAEICRDSEQYQRLVIKERQAYERLAELGLTRKQREAVEEAYEAQSAADAEYAVESYFCGLADCLQFIEYVKEKGTRN